MQKASFATYLLGLSKVLGKGTSMFVHRWEVKYAIRHDVCSRHHHWLRNLTLSKALGNGTRMYRWDLNYASTT